MYPELAYANPFDDHALHVINSLIEKCRIAERLTGNGLNLSGKIGVMLRGGPQHKDQMLRLYACQSSFINPAFNNCRFVIHQLLKIACQLPFRSGAPCSISRQKSREA